MRVAGAKAAADREDWASALAAVDRAAELDSGSIDVHLLRGRLLRQSDGDQAVQIRAFRRASECEDAPPLRRAEAYQEYGRLLNELGEADAAADAYRDGLNLIADDPLPAIPHLTADQA